MALSIDKHINRHNAYREFVRGYADAVQGESNNIGASEHWQAGWHAGYFAREQRNVKLNEYLKSIGHEPMDTMTT
jgi:hypothetical protein